MEFLYVGQTGDIVSTLVQAGTPEDLVAQLKNVLVKGMKYNFSTNPGAPISFTMRYVGSRANAGPYPIAIAQMVTNLSPEIVSLESKQAGVLEFGMALKAGWKDTGIDLLNGH